MLLVLANEASKEGLAVIGTVIGGHMGKVSVVITSDTRNENERGRCRR
jgi:hypothetical protein